MESTAFTQCDLCIDSIVWWRILKITVAEKEYFVCPSCANAIEALIRKLSKQGN